MSDVTNTTAIANKVLELLEQGASKVGETASTAFPYVVRYEWAQALTGLSIGLFFLVAALCGVWGFSVSAKKNVALKAANQYYDGSDVLMGWAVITFLATILAMTCIGFNLATVIEPTGATIERILRLATKTVN